MPCDTWFHARPAPPTPCPWCVPSRRRSSTRPAGAGAVWDRWHAGPVSPSGVPLRDVVAQIPAYVPGARSVDADVHRLASNENPYPPLDSVREVVREAASSLNRYPDMFATELNEAIAAKHGVEVASVVAGCGSVAVLGHVLQAFCDAGDRVVYAWR